MNAIQNFAFEEHLVRVIEQNGEPWFVGKDVCGALGLKNHNDALARLDEDERGGAITDPPRAGSLGGGVQEVTIVSEPGVYRLVFSSRKHEAERFKRWLAHEVLPQIRKTGKYESEGTNIPAEPLVSDQRAALALITEARMIYGPARARLLWESLPALPAVPSLPKIAAEDEREAFACLGFLLQQRPEGAFTVQEFIEEAFEGEADAQKLLRDVGIRIETDRQLGAGIVVATSADQVNKLFFGTQWAAGNHAAALRALPGAVRYKTMKFRDNRASSSIFIPARVLHPD